MNSHSCENDSGTDSCIGGFSHCAIYTFVLSFSTFIFVASMILTVYLTHIDSIDMALVVLIVTSCLLYLSGFLGNMYSIYHIKPSSTPSENGENSNRSSHIAAASSQSISSNQRPPDIVRVSRARQFFRKTPPPPYEVQMLEMSRMLLPGTSRTTESSEREAEIAEEARKLIQRLYEEIRTTNQLAQQSSTDKQSVQQVAQTPKTPMAQLEATSPKALHQNMAIQKQKTVVKSSPSHGQPPGSFRTNQIIQQKKTSSLPTQVDVGRLITGCEGCSAVPSQLSRIPGCSPVDLHTNQAIKQKRTANLLPCQPDLQKIVIDSDGCVVSPQLPPRRENFLKVAHKRKLNSSSQELQTRPKTKGNIAHMGAVDSNFQNNVYEEIDDVKSILSASSSQTANYSVEYYCTKSELEDPPEEASINSTVFEPSPTERKRNLGIPSVKERRQLSMLSTRKFYQLGKSPETVLDAIAMCFDLTPEEWMTAWKLSQRGIPPDERARILGVRLQENS